MLSWLRNFAMSLLQPKAGRPVTRRAAMAKLPTEFGDFNIYVYTFGDEEHVAMVKGDISNGTDVLTRVHSACLTGDIFHSARCDCGPQLNLALKRIEAEGRGIVLYLNQEGRGIGLANKIRAYELQDEGYDTVEANERLGFPADARDYRVGVEILGDLGVRSIRLLSNNPLKLSGVTGADLVITARVPIEVEASDTTRRYLQTKKEKMGHQLSSV